MSSNPDDIPILPMLMHFSRFRTLTEVPCGIPIKLQVGVPNANAFGQSRRMLLWGIFSLNKSVCCRLPCGQVLAAQCC